MIFVCNDTGALLTAKRAGVRAYPVPDGWLLPPEPDEKDRRIRWLEEQTAALLETKPALLLTLSRSDGDEGPIEHVVRDCKEFGDVTITELAGAMAAKHPMVDLPDELPPNTPWDTLGPLKRTFWRHCLAMYRDRDYPAYLTALREFYRRLGIETCAAQRRIPIELAISNDGFVPASNVLLDIEVFGGGRLGELPQGPIVMPEAPVPPRPDDMNTVPKIFGPTDPGIHATAFTPHETKPDDPHEFYWRDRNEKRWSFRCTEFRHKARARRFSVLIRIPRAETPTKVILKATASASNLPEPVTGVQQINLAYVPTSITDLIDPAVLP